MAEQILFYAKLLFANWQTALYGGFAVIGVIIALVGVLKRVTKNKIQSKQVRKVIYFFSSLVLVLPVTAICFLIDGINFNHYWVGCLLSCIGVIVAYVFYENTLLRDLLQKIGRLTIYRWISGKPVDKTVVDGEIESVVAEAIQGDETRESESVESEDNKSAVDRFMDKIKK